MIKQVIVIRKDLHMQRGKEIAQGSHASMYFITNRISAGHIENEDYLINLTKDELEWINGSFAKICVQVNSEQELLDLHKAALDAGIQSNLVTDSGKTYFNGVPTNTCIAIGPADSDLINKITGHLKLY